MKGLMKVVGQHQIIMFTSVFLVLGSVHHVIQQRQQQAQQQQLQQQQQQASGSWSVVWNALNAVSYLHSYTNAKGVLTLGSFNVSDATSRPTGPLQDKAPDFKPADLERFWSQNPSPPGAIQCVIFVRSVYKLAGDELPGGPGTAQEYWPSYKNSRSWIAVPNGAAPPLPGDILIQSGSSAGHMSIIVAVNQNNIIVAQANTPYDGGTTFDTPNADLPGVTVSGLHLDKMPLEGNTIKPNWNGFTVNGYIRSPRLVQWATGNNASQNAQAINQYRMNSNGQVQYTEAEFNAWSARACSIASMAAVINAYGWKNNGQPFTIHDLIPAMTTGDYPAVAAGGLQGSGPEIGGPLKRAMEKLNKQYGLDFSIYSSGSGKTLDQIIDIANKGTPVIVNVGQSAQVPHFSGGHIMVVTGGDANNVRVADSSGVYSSGTVSRSDFASMWAVKSNGYFIMTSNHLSTIGHPINIPQAPPDCIAQGTDATLRALGLSTSNAKTLGYVKLAWDAACSYHIPPVFFIKQINQESNFNPTIVQKKSGAQGIAQFLPSEAPKWGVSNPFDPASALPGGARYMSTFYCRYLGTNITGDESKWYNDSQKMQNCFALMDRGFSIVSYNRALIAYNAGPAMVGKPFESQYKETRDYIMIITGQPVA